MDRKEIIAAARADRVPRFCFDHDVGIEALGRLILAEREACTNALNLSRSDVQLMAGEMTAQEWRTVSAVLKALQSRMRSDVEEKRSK